MGLRKSVFIVVSVLVMGLLFASVTNALEPSQESRLTTLENVRDFAPALGTDGINYAADSGRLYIGVPGMWNRVETPSNVIVNAVAMSSADSSLVYIGAANEMAIYRSSDAGVNWMRIPLVTENVGSVTDIAVDAANHLVYVGTDTDGVHRLRDVGSSMIASGHLLLNERVEQVVADSSGQGIALVRTQWNLYRAEDMGLRWISVDSLPSPATAVALANTNPTTIYVGTASSGLRSSTDGVNWQSVNSGLNLTPGSHLSIDALAVDPSQPDVVYVSSSLSFGSTELHTSHMGVSMSNNGAANWATLSQAADVAITDLFPMTGYAGSILALTENSRTPVALGQPVPASVPSIVAASTPADQGMTGLMVWVLIALSLMGLAVIAALEYVGRSREETLGHSVLHLLHIRH